MKNLLLFIMVSSLGLAFSLFTGCAETSEHVATTPEKSGTSEATATGGHVVACQMCYDEVRTVFEAHAKGMNWGTVRTIKTHHCKDCKTDMKIYVNDDGVAMFKCAKCAPEGMACDKCLPPRSGS